MMSKRNGMTRWMAIVGTAAALVGAAAWAQRMCMDCDPCGCGADGGYILCCSESAC